MKNNRSISAAACGSLVLGYALLLTVLFWGSLWIGYGLVGGDLYSYFLPQKTFLADRLRAGEFPLWNNLTGFGYPILGESQTGAAYPLHWFVYYCLNPNTAYNVQHLFHYVLCFVATWLFAKRIGIGVGGSMLTATVFTYGWFPPRVCLEWAILTGAWLPVALWCVESFSQTRLWRYSIGLSVVLGVQLLAGHFHLAFMTQLLVLAYGSWRLYAPVSGQSRCLAFPAGLCLLLAVCAGFLLAAVQLLPAWELKTRSSRASVGEAHEPSAGHLPPLYISQLVAPWLWYNPQVIDGNEAIRTISELAAPWHWFGPHRDLDESLSNARTGGLTGISTNKVEAHLYCGLVPVGLAIGFLILRRRIVAIAAPGKTAEGYQQQDAVFWMVCGGLALVYATGWLLPIARYLPGFNFFRGPGRYGIITTLAIAVLAGRGFDQWTWNRTLAGRIALTVGIFWSTIGDLWLVSRMVTYTQMVSTPAILFRDESPVRKLLLAEPQMPRLYIPGGNVGNLLGVSCLPIYFGIAPTEYSDPRFWGEGMPKQTPGDRAILGDQQFSVWLRESGVTHILSFSQLEQSSWNVQPLWQGIDPMLNRAWGRSEPLFLYQLIDSPGRASIVDEYLAGNEPVVDLPAQREANRLAVTTQTSKEATLVARDLAYPGWNATIDGRPLESSSAGSFRSVSVPSGTHRVTWTYRPTSVWVGLAISLVMCGILAAIGHVRYWHTTWLDQRLSQAFAWLGHRSTG